MTAPKISWTDLMRSYMLPVESKMAVPRPWPKSTEQKPAPFVDYDMHVSTCPEHYGPLVVIATTAEDLKEQGREVSSISQLIALAAYRHLQRVQHGGQND